MAGMRVRCVCGTVFDPAAVSACPACGAAYNAKTPVPSSEPVAFPSTTVRGAVERGAATMDGGMTRRQSRFALMIVGAVAGVLLLAFVIRGFIGGNDRAKSTKQSSERVAMKDGAASGEAGDGATHGESSRGDSSHGDSTNGGGSNDAREDDGDGSGDTRGDVPPSDERSSPRGHEQSDKTPVVPAPASETRLFEGRWKLLASRMQPESVIPGMPATSSTIAQVVTAAFSASTPDATLTIDAHGGYALDIDVSGSGQYTANLSESPNLLSVAAQGVLTMTPKGGVVSDRTRALLKPVRMDMPQLHAKADDTQLALTTSGESNGSPSNWFRSSSEGEPHTSVIGEWFYEPVYVDSYVPYRGTLTLKENGDYEIRFVRKEEGIFKAAGGEYEFSRTAGSGRALTGEYAFDGPDRFTLTESRGTATWVRDGAGRKRGVRR